MESCSLTCSFCSEFNLEEENNLFLTHLKDRLNSKDRILFETDNWYVVPTLGAISEGYLLFVSKKHYLSLGHCPEEYYSELRCLMESVRRVFRKVYSKDCIAFEHGGASSSNKGGCCVDHAHIHMLPFNGDLKSDVIKLGLNIREVQELDAFKEQISNDKPYLFYQDNNGLNYLIEGPVIPSQFLRQIIARKLDVMDKWDWRQNYELDNIEKTMKDISREMIASEYDQLASGLVQKIS